MYFLFREFYGNNMPEITKDEKNAIRAWKFVLFLVVMEIINGLLKLAFG